MSKPTLGFRTRTEAALHLKAQGRGPTEIGKQLGITAAAAGGLTASANRHRGPRTGEVPRVMRVDAMLDSDTHRQLRPYAEKRGISLEALILKIIHTVADEKMVDAILDDQEDTIQ